MEKKAAEAGVVFWFETSDSVCRRHHFEPNGHLSVRSSFPLILKWVFFRYLNVRYFQVQGVI